MNTPSHMILGELEKATIPVMNHHGHKWNSFGEPTAEVRLAYEKGMSIADLQLWHGPDDQATRVIINRDQALVIARALTDWATNQS